MDPVAITTIGVIVAAMVSGGALVLSSHSNTTATATASLLTAQSATITRMDAQIAARDSTIEDLRTELSAFKVQLEDCERGKKEQDAKLDRMHERIREVEGERRSDPRAVHQGEQLALGEGLAVDHVPDGHDHPAGLDRPGPPGQDG